MAKLLNAMLVAALSCSALLAADPQPAPQPTAKPNSKIAIPQPFSAQSLATTRPAASASAYTPETPRKTSGLSKGKIAWIVVGIGAVVTGVVLANRAIGTSTTAGAPPAAQTGTVVLVNGVPR